MKRVLMVSCYGLGNGGVQAIMMGIIRNLASECHFDILLFTNEKRYYDEEFLSYGGSIFRIPQYNGSSRLRKRIDGYLSDYYRYKKINEILDAQEPYDVIHCNNQYESAPLLKAAAKHSIPIRICHSHVFEEPSTFLLSILNRIRSSYIKKYSTHLIGCSREACDSFFPLSAKYRVVPNFYDDKKYVYKALEAAPNGSIVLTQLGAFSSNKNQLFSVSVASCLIKMGVKVELNLIGFQLEPKYKDKVEDEVRRLQMEGVVRFHPGDTDIPIVLNKTNVFLMPSWHEGFGIALIEAQAIGIQCFASSSVPQTTNCGGVTYLDISGADAPMIWAKNIYNKKCTDGLSHSRFDTSKYKLSNVISVYKNIYGV